MGSGNKMIELETPNRAQYRYFPVTSGSLNFKVKSTNDACITFTPGHAESDRTYLVILGGWGNTKSVLRKNRTASFVPAKTNVSESSTPEILSPEEFRGFWVRWHGGIIQVGKEAEEVPFLKWEDPDPPAIGYYGICTVEGATGTWVLQGIVREVQTPDNQEFMFRPVPVGAIEVLVQAKSNARISLTSAPQDTDPMYEITLGENKNEESNIRFNHWSPDKVTEKTPKVLDSDDFRHFVVRWDNGLLAVFAGNMDEDPMMEWRDPHPFGISHFGVRTDNGATGKWRVRTFDPRQAGRALDVNVRPTPVVSPEISSHVWVDAANGEVPLGAVPGGYDKEQLFVGRVKHWDAVIPGKVMPSHGVCYVAVDGGVFAKKEYQVLVISTWEAKWIPASRGDIPPRAESTGYTRHGEPLYTARAKHEDSVTVGCIQTTKVCIITYRGKVVECPDYEVLILQKPAWDY